MGEAARRSRRGTCEVRERNSLTSAVLMSLLSGAGAYLARYWMFSGHVREARGWLAELQSMSASEPVTPRTRARVMAAAVGADVYDQDLTDIQIRVAESVATARQAGDPWCAAYALWPYIAAVLHLELI